MNCVQEISSQVFWVGGSDRRIERFENMFPLTNGVAYNSYLIMDEQTALMDTVDAAISGLYLENIEHVLNGRKLDYLVINHMEPDHCANIEEIVRRYPEVKVVGNTKTFQFFSQYYSLDISSNHYLVKEGDEISIGKHTLRFYMAPMVHWPEVMFTYEVFEGILFSADAFGSFGAFAGNVFADQVDYNSSFEDDARRYYSNIVGKYGAQVQAIIKKVSGLEINMICSVHGLIWRGETIPYILEKYNLWSTYTAEKEGVVLAYASMYGNTENAVNALASKLAQRGVKDMRMYDVSKTHASYVISDVWKYSHVVLASPTYNLQLYFMMNSLLEELGALGIKNRKFALLGNHSWSSSALKKMTEIVGTYKNCEILEPSIDIKSSLREDREAELDAMADAIVASMNNK